MLLQYAIFMVAALIPIYFGSIRANREKEDEQDEVQQITMGDAKRIPLFLSGVILVLYLAVKMFLNKYLDLLILLYFAVISIVPVSIVVEKFLLYLATEERMKKYSYVFSIKKASEKDTCFSKCIELSMVISIIASSIILSAYLKTRGWILNNFISECFAYTALSVSKLDSVKTSFFLLLALVVYDVFWVFGTDVMITVATGLNVPVKLVLPRKLFFSFSEFINPKSGFMLLGLGDIIVPGLFSSMCLGLDLFTYRLSARESQLPAKMIEQNIQETNYMRPYFKGSLYGYVLGLSTAFLFSYLTNVGQPALLYIIPMMLIHASAVAIAKGEVKIAWNAVFSEETPNLPEKKNPLKRTKSTPKKPRKKVL